MHAAGRRRGYALVDVLVSLAVICVLISMLAPSMAAVHETSRLVVCRSAMRQHGVGIALYAQDWNGMLPPTVFVRGAMPRPQETITLRRHLAPGRAAWDGLGTLYAGAYLEAPRIFYCPSQRGPGTFHAAAPAWSTGDAELVGNYQYRGEGPGRERHLAAIDPARAALAADSLRDPQEYNHRVGANVVRADLSADWSNHLPGSAFSARGTAATRVTLAWRALDLAVGAAPDGAGYRGGR